MLANQSERSYRLEQSLTQILLTSDSYSIKLSRLAQLIGEALLAEGCLIMAYAPESGQKLVSSWSVGPLATDETTSSEQKPELPATLDWIPLDGVPSDASIQFFPYRSQLSIPTPFQGQANGMIVLLHSQAHQWNEADARQVSAIAPQLAMVLAQFGLEQQISQQRQFQALTSELMAAVRNVGNLDQILQMAVEGLTSSLQVSRSMILLFKYTDPLHRTRSTQDAIKAKVSLAAECSALPEHPLYLSSRFFWTADCRFCQQLIHHPQPIVRTGDEGLASSAGSQGVSEAIAPILDPAHLPALLMVPLEHQATVLGCVVVQHHQRRSWTAAEIEFVQLTAAQLSTAIIQTRSLQQIQSVVQERTAQLQRSLEVQAMLYEKTRKQVEQLRRLNEEREEFLSTISHELRTPLTSMSLAIRMLRQAELPAEKRLKYLDILDQQCLQETNLINDLLALRKLETSPSAVSLQKVDLRQLIDVAVQAIASDCADKDVELAIDLPERVLVYTDPDSFSRIILELLTNAKKYADSDSTIHLKLEQVPATHQLTLTLKNTGIGILPEELPYVFDKFRRCREVTQKAIQGTGLGLALVKRLVEHLSGTITASSYPLEQGAWETCFTVTLSQYPEEGIRAIC